MNPVNNPLIPSDTTKKRPLPEGSEESKAKRQRTDDASNDAMDIDRIPNIANPILSDSKDIDEKDRKIQELENRIRILEQTSTSQKTQETAFVNFTEFAENIQKKFNELITGINRNNIRNDLSSTLKKLTSFYLPQLLLNAPWSSLTNSQKSIFWISLVEVLSSADISPQNIVLLKNTLVLLFVQPSPPGDILPRQLAPNLFKYIHHHFSPAMSNNFLCLNVNDRTYYLLPKNTFPNLISNSLHMIKSLEKAFPAFLAFLNGQKGKYDQFYSQILCLAERLGVRNSSKFPQFSPEIQNLKFSNYAQDYLKNGKEDFFDDLYQVTGPLLLDSNQAQSFLGLSSPQFWGKYVLVNFFDSSKSENKPCGHVLMDRELLQLHLFFQMGLFPTNEKTIRVDIPPEFNFESHFLFFSIFHTEFPVQLNLEQNLSLLKLAIYHDYEKLKVYCEKNILEMIKAPNNVIDIFHLAQNLAPISPAIPILKSELGNRLEKAMCSSTSQNDFIRFTPEVTLFINFGKVFIFSNLELASTHFGKHITSLYLKYLNNFESELERLKEVSTLVVGEFNLENKTVKTLQKLVSLETLEIKGFRVWVEDDIEQSLPIKNLILPQHTFTHKKLDVLFSIFPELTSISLPYHTLQSHAKKIKKITSLTLLEDTSPSGREKHLSTSHLLPLKNLKTLHLSKSESSFVSFGPILHNEDNLELGSVEEFFSDHSSFVPHVDVLKAFPNIKNLRLTIEPSWWETIKTLTNLRILNINLFRSGVEKLAIDFKTFINLEELHLDPFNYTKESILSLKDIHPLKKIVLSPHTMIPLEIFENLLKKPNLKYLECKVDASSDIKHLISYAAERGITLVLK